MGLMLKTGGGGGATAPEGFEEGNYTLRLDMVSDPLAMQCVWDERDVPYDECRKEEQAEWSFRIVGGPFDGTVVRQRITHLREFDNTDEDGVLTRVPRYLWSEKATFGAFVRAVLGLPEKGNLPPGTDFDTNKVLGRTIRGWVSVNERGYFKIEKPKATAQGAPARREPVAVASASQEADENPF